MITPNVMTTPQAIPPKVELNEQLKVLTLLRSTHLPGDRPIDDAARVTVPNPVDNTV